MSPASRPRALVGTTIHHADDVRISRKLIPALTAAFDVTYVSREPGPSIDTGARWVGLPGGRLRRWWGLLVQARSLEWDVLVLHDPETLPIGWWARRRGVVVFDLHERLPDQLRTKVWIPSFVRPSAALLAGWMLRRTDRLLSITLAEAGYRDLIGQDAPVFPNHPRPRSLSEVPANGRVIYVGDVTEQRGAVDVVAACVLAGLPLDVVGPVDESLRDRLEGIAGAHDVQVLGRMPHEAAMAKVAESSVAVSPLHDLPNYRWSMPTKLEEYLAAGVPVVASDLPGTAAAAVDRAVVLFPSGDVEALAEALGTSIDDSDLHRRAKEQASEIPTWSDVDVRSWYLGQLRRS